MKELVRVVMEKPSLLSSIDPAQIENADDFVIISLMAELHKQGIIPTTQAVADELAQMEDGKNLVRHLLARMAVPVERDETYLLSAMREEYNRKLLFSLFNEGLKALRNDPALSVVDMVNKGLSGISMDTPVINNDDAARSAMENLSRIYSGLKEPYWQTNLPKLDRVMGLTQRMLVMIAAQQKTGKSRAVTHLVMELIKHHPELDVRWWSLEMHSDEMFILIISWLTGIDSRVINGKSRMPTKEEIDVIHKAADMARKFPITWLGRKKPTMDVIKRDTLKHKPKLVVIDNLGGIINEKDLNDIQFENRNAQELVDMRDNSDSCIIALHHLTKESMGHFNKENAFEPQVRHVRGSNKWADSVNLMILLHRPEMYDELKRTMSAESWLACQNKIHVKVPLGRDGPQGEVVLNCDMATSRFWE